jgi:2-oxoglutarate ferredoxin oxidoreductase subunit alpha
LGEVVIMKGNEALAEAAIRAGMDAYFGYPITPQSEVIEYLAQEIPKRGGIILQAESEVAAINMIYGAGGAGGRVMTTSSSPGISLMQEGISYIAGAEIPCLLANVNRGGPGLGTIQPAQGDYFQSTRGGGHGDYYTICLAPASVQEMFDFVYLGFELAEKYRNPALILSDGALGQMMEKVKLREDKLPKNDISWAATGKPKTRDRNIVTSLFLQPEKMEKINLGLQAKYKKIRENEQRWETRMTDDAEYLITAYGLSARIGMKAVDILRDKGYKIGLFRPITLWPYPIKGLSPLLDKVKKVLDFELNAGQMIEDVELVNRGRVPVSFFGRMGGMIPSPDDVAEFFIKEVAK